MKKLLYFILLLFCLSCGKKDKQYVIGVSQCSEDIWRQKLNRELMTNQYIHHNVRLEISSADDDYKKQINLINKFINAKVDLLIVSPTQINEISSVIDKAYDSGIPIILFDRKTRSQKYTAFIGADNYNAGKVMGDYIARNMPKNGKILEIKGIRSASPTIDRHRGFLSALKNYPGIKVVTIQGDWTEENAEKIAKEVFMKEKGFNYVFGHNDRQAIGAYKAAQSLGIKNIKFVGIDALPSPGGGIECVQKGILDASYLYPTRGNEVMQLAMNILQHKSFKKINLLNSAVVTKSNADILMMENTEMERQSGNLEVLHKQVDGYLQQYNSQQLILFLFLAIIVLLLATAIFAYYAYLTKVRMSERKEKQSQARLSFFTNVSHELRTPLTLIVDPIEKLSEDPNIKGESRYLLHVIERNAKSLLQLVNTILDFRKAQTNKEKLKMMQFDIVATINTLAEDFRLPFKNKGVSLDVHVPSECRITGDEEKINRILMNIVSNALKYTSDGGNVNVQLDDTDVNVIVISIQDTGVGINADEVNDVFDEFYQAKNAVGGTGIGLALAKILVELHRGTIKMNSKKGEGTEVVITLPRIQPLLNDEQVESSVVDADEKSVARTLVYDKIDNVLEDGRPTVLIIEDNEDVRNYEHFILQNTYNVVEAKDGKEGLDVAVNTIPDMIVCDIMMPEMDGLELCNHIKEETATSHIPVILLTARNLEDQKVEGYEHGADSYITKPFSSKLLLARINNLLENRKNLKKLFSDGQDVEENNLGIVDKIFMDKLMDLIHENISDQDLSVEYIGMQLSLSRVQLYRKVKALTGMAPVELIRKVRLNLSMKMLKTTDKNISEIAYDVGFSAPSYFTKCFKDEYNVSPNEIRIKK